MKNMLKLLCILPVIILARIYMVVGPPWVFGSAYVLSFLFFFVDFLGYGATSHFILVPIVLHGAVMVVPFVFGAEVDPSKLTTGITRTAVGTGFVVWVMIGLLAMWSLDMLPWSIWWILSPAILISINMMIVMFFLFLGDIRKFLKEITEGRLATSRKKAWKSKSKSDKNIDKFKKENMNLKIEVKKLRNQSTQRGVKRLQKENDKLQRKMGQKQGEATRQRQGLERRVASLEKDLHKKNEELEQLLKEVLVVNDDSERSALDSPSTLSLEGERILLVGGSPDKIQGQLDHIRKLGGEAFHDNKHSAKRKVKNATLVVCWVKFFSHDIYYSVKQTCKKNKIPMVHWNESSSASLERVITIGLQKTSEPTL